MAQAYFLWCTGSQSWLGCGVCIDSCRDRGGYQVVKLGLGHLNCCHWCGGGECWFGDSFWFWVDSLLVCVSGFEVEGVMFCGGFEFKEFRFGFAIYCLFCGSMIDVVFFDWSCIS